MDRLIYVSNYDEVDPVIREIGAAGRGAYGVVELPGAKEDVEYLTFNYEVHRTALEIARKFELCDKITLMIALSDYDTYELYVFTEGDDADLDILLPRVAEVFDS